MKLIFQRQRMSARADESGMTLIEVVVAISLIGIIATAAISLGITSQKGSTTQQRQEIAVTVANEAMEAVSARSSATNPTTGVSYLYQGRAEDKVDAAWLTNAGASGLDATYKVWTDATQPLAVPISKEVPRNGTIYTVFTLIGSCYVTTVGSGSCTKVPGHDLAPPATVPSGSIQMNRIMVIVRWKAESGCAASGCSYSATSLVDAHSDLLWNTP